MRKITAIKIYEMAICSSRRAHRSGFEMATNNEKPATQMIPIKINVNNITQFKLCYSPYITYRVAFALSRPFFLSFFFLPFFSLSFLSYTTLLHHSFSSLSFFSFSSLSFLSFSSLYFLSCTTLLHTHIQTNNKNIAECLASV